MYTLTRQEAATVLSVSTRSIDRYIRSGKIRSKKEGKIIYINNDDIERLKNWEKNQEVIIPQKVDKENRHNEAIKKEISYNDNKQRSETKEVLENIYQDLKKEIEKKDEVIQSLSLQLWKAEEVAKNSISLMEFKKSQFLLEESKGHLSWELEKIKSEKSKIEKELKYEKSTNNIMILFLIILLLLIAIIWFIKA